MCGIVGFIERDYCNLGKKLVERLAALEYRGYDSAGIVVHGKERFRIVKSVGDLSKLREKLHHQKTESNIGFGHTRWATHGVPSERNALPIGTADGSMVIVFNGIVENHIDLKAKLTSQGVIFSTDNDAETLLLWMLQFYRGDLEEAVRLSLPSVKGRYACAVMHQDHQDKMVVAKQHNPMIIGNGPLGFSIASDVLAIQSDADEIYYLDDGCTATIHADRLRINSVDGVEQVPTFIPTPFTPLDELNSEYETHTLREIYSQPDTVANGLLAAIESREQIRRLAPRIDRVTFVGCGTSYYSCMIGKSFVEEFAAVPSDANIASEFHLGSPIINDKTLAVFVSQSGETADTLVCLEMARSCGAVIVVLCNVLTSTMARQVDILLPISCGPEIGVASTRLIQEC